MGIEAVCTSCGTSYPEGQWHSERCISKDDREWLEECIDPEGLDGSALVGEIGTDMARRNDEGCIYCGCPSLNLRMELEDE